jgi:sugar (pentulose or hexulose) kinase
MRCYNNGAQFLDRVVGTRPDWAFLEQEARKCQPGADGFSLLPFIAPEPSLGLSKTGLTWTPTEPQEPGKRFRASLEALAYLIALGVREHEAAGQKVMRITVSGGIAKSDLMCAILASVLDKPLHRLRSSEGPALGAAVTALAAVESHLRKQKRIDRPFTVADAVAILVQFRDVVEPNKTWHEVYATELANFEKRLSN